MYTTKKRLVLYIGMLLSIILSSCRSINEKPIVIDFSVNYKDSLDYSDNDSIIPINVAVSTMISPSETFRYYKELFDYIAVEVGRPINFKQKKTYKEVNDMLLSNKVDIAFICSGAYIGVSNDVDLLVAPVCDGRPYYQAYVIAYKSPDIESFADFKNKSFAFTDPMSNTGKLYALKRVKEIDSSGNIFFSKTIYTHSHDMSIQMVSKKAVAGATIDGLVFEYFKKFNPERIENLKIIEKSEFYGMPPIVTSKGVDTNLKKQLENLFLNIHYDEEVNKILQNLMINKFTIVNDIIYDNIRNVHQFVNQ